MREILFRGKTVDGIWIFGNVEVISKDVVFIHYDMEHAYRVIPETVGQYAGVEDKNGVKIFEGDILKVKTMWNVIAAEGNIEKIETHWSVEYKKYSTEMGYTVFGIDRRFHKPMTWAEAEVVGNIYDNPELMR